jgi:O-antigen ligase
LERSFVYVLFLFLMGVATSLIYADESADTYLALQGSLHGPIVLIQACLSLIALFLISTRWRRVAAAGLKAWPLLVLAAIQVLSIGWSIHPDITARKDVFELVMLSIGIYLGERYTINTLATLLARVLCGMMVMIGILYVAAPRFVLDADQHNALKGLAQNKNGFGFYIGLTVALLLLVRFKRFDWLRYLFLPVALGMLVLSHSMTSVAAAAIIIMTLPIWFVARLPIRQRVVGYLCVAVTAGIVGSLTALYLSRLLALLGRDSTLTGRTEVWSQLIFAIQHHPILGYGYGSFWTGLSGESLDVLVAAGWIVPSAHNAYLELWLALGIPGVVATIVIFWDVFRRAIKYIRTEPGWPGLWPVACILFVLVHGLGESEFIYDSSFACCLFTALYTSLVLKGACDRRSPVLARHPTQVALSTGLVTS